MIYQCKCGAYLNRRDEDYDEQYKIHAINCYGRDPAEFEEKPAVVAPVEEAAPEVEGSEEAAPAEEVAPPAKSKAPTPSAAKKKSAPKSTKAGGK